MNADGPTPPEAPASSDAAAPGARRFPCAKCGAQLAFAPGTDTLACAFCGAVNTIEGDHTELAELDYVAHLERLAEQADTVDRIVSHCDTCGATVEMAENVTSDACPFCGAEVVATGLSAKLIRPGAVLPFALPRDRARASFRRWISKRWFAPSKLKHESRLEHKLAGVYLPYWTYDSRTTTDYTGQRGEHYYVSVPYTTTVNGKTVTRTRQERRTRWYPAAGRVANAFDDLLVPASTSLPADLVRELEPWDLASLRAYTDAYLAGFRAESYAVGLPDGFRHAEQLMQPTIDATIRADIGGDVQRISSKSMTHTGVTFKHILLPVWVCAYLYRDKVYQVLVNAQTGEVVGDRPYSVWKITAASLAALAAIVVFVIAVLAIRGH